MYVKEAMFSIYAIKEQGYEKIIPVFKLYMG
jgi:hypothetical protein